jgi:hypothetical protein
MEVVEFEGCCTAKIVTGFGQTETAEYEYRPTDNPYLEAGELPVNAIEGKLRSLERRRRARGDAVLTAITNNEQVNANEALLNQGWQHSGWMSKTQHPNTKVRLWFKPLMEEEQ